MFLAYSVGRKKTIPPLARKELKMGTITTQPVTKSNKRFFARFDRCMSEISLILTPSANKLWVWLLHEYPSGKPVEVDLRDFIDFSHKRRRGSFSEITVKRAYKQLVDLGLVIEIYKFDRWNRKIYCRDLDSIDENFLNNKRASNPHGSVPIYREEYNKIQDTCGENDQEKGDPPEDRPDDLPPTQKPLEREFESPIKKPKKQDPVAPTATRSADFQYPAIAKTVTSQGKTNKVHIKDQISSKKSEEIKIEPELIAEVKAAIAPKPINPELKRLIAAAKAHQVRQAIAVVNERKAAGKCHNPPGLLRSALLNGWEPSKGDNNQPRKNRLSRAVCEWLEAANRIGVAISATVRDGIEFVYMPDKSLNSVCCIAFEEAKERYPLEVLREDVAF